MIGNFHQSSTQKSGAPHEANAPSAPSKTARLAPPLRRDPGQAASGRHDDQRARRIAVVRPRHPGNRSQAQRHACAPARRSRVGAARAPDHHRRANGPATTRLGQIARGARSTHVPLSPAGLRLSELFRGLLQLGGYGSGDPSRTTSHSAAGSSHTSDAIDRQSHAAARLRGIDRAMRNDLGMHGLMIARAVLVARKAAGTGALSKREKQVSGFIFRSCLTLIAIQLGLATKSIKREDRAIERKLRKDGIQR